MSPDGTQLLCPANAIFEIKKASVKIAIDSVKQAISTSVDKSKLENIDNPNIDPIDDAFSLECDVFSPCALGAIFNKSSIKSLNCKKLFLLKINICKPKFYSKKLHFLN